MFDFFMSSEDTVPPPDKKPAALFFSSSSPSSPSMAGESNFPETDPMLHTMKADMSKKRQLMDNLAARARIVSESEVQNLRADSASS